MVEELTQESFERKVVLSGKPAVIKIWAPWCGPCRAYAPIFEEFATECGDTYLCAQVDIDVAADLASTYGIISIPTTLFFKDGTHVASEVGLLSKDELARKSKELI